MDGNSFNPRNPQWSAIEHYYKKYPGQLAPSERLLLQLSGLQWAYRLVMKAVMALHKQAPNEDKIHN